MIVSIVIVLDARRYITVIVTFATALGATACSLSPGAGDPPEITDAGYVEAGATAFDAVSTLTAGAPYDLVIFVHDPDGDLDLIAETTTAPDRSESTVTRFVSDRTERAGGHVFGVTAPAAGGIYTVTLVAEDERGDEGNEFSFAYSVE